MGGNKDSIEKYIRPQGQYVPFWVPYNHPPLFVEVMENNDYYTMHHTTTDPKKALIMTDEGEANKLCQSLGRQWTLYTIKRNLLEEVKMLPTGIESNK